MTVVLLIVVFACGVAAGLFLRHTRETSALMRGYAMGRADERTNHARRKVMT